MRWFRTPRRSASNNKLSLQQLEDRATPSAVVTAVTINSLQVGANQTQRSRVTDLAVSFDSHVTFVGSPEAAFSLNRVSGGPFGSVTLVAAVDNSGPGSVVTLTFVILILGFAFCQKVRMAGHLRGESIRECKSHCCEYRM